MAEYANPSTAVGTAGAVPVAYTDTATRLAFLRKVYLLFSGSVVVWAGTALYAVTNEALLLRMFGLFRNPLILILLLVGVMFLLPRVVSKGTPVNYLALAAFGILEGLLTAPLIFIALLSTAESDAVANAAIASLQAGDGSTSVLLQNGAGLLTSAFLLTGVVFGGISAYALTTKRDFSFLRGALWMVFWVLMGIGILAMFGIGRSFVLGWGWSAAWVLLMGGFLLYDTQNIMKRFPANQAALAAAVLLINFVIMFKHILLLLSRRD